MTQTGSTTWSADRLAKRATPQQSTPALEAVRRLEGWLHLEAGRALEWSHDGLLIKVTEADGRCSQYCYDACADLVAIHEPDGSLRTFAYDERRRLKHVTQPDGSLTEYHYEQDRLIQVQDRGVVTRYSYDALGRLERVSRGNAGCSVYRYDVAGRVAEARTARVSCGYSYDDQGQITTLSQTIDGVTVMLRFAFDDLGRLATLTMPGDAIVRYRWNEHGRPSEVILHDLTIARFSYEDAARMTQIQFANGLIEATSADILAGHTLDRRVLRGDETLLARSYHYDSAGRITSDGLSSYHYDAAGRLAAATSAESHRTRLFAYDSLNRCVGEEPMSAASFDLRGRLTRKISGTDNFTYLYDDADQLVEVRRNATVIAGFIYDHKGRVAQANLEGQIERYLYGPTDELLAVTDAAGQLMRALVHTPLGTLAELQGTVLRFLHHDARGTRIATSDSTGAIVAHFAYDPFGLPDAQPGETAPAFHRCEWRAEVSLYNVG
ncbi:MAG TPA: hypothetical protein VGD69_09625, partial [Herpetosiphonaceae bacterium]